MTTATTAPLTPAELAAFYDELNAAAAIQRQAEAAAEQAARQQIADDLDAEILAAIHAAGIDPEYLTIRPTENFYRRTGRIAMPGFDSFELRAEYNGDGNKISAWVWFDGSSYGKADRSAISNAMNSARRRYVAAEADAHNRRQRLEAEQAQQQAEQTERQASQAAALAAWAPLYRRYVTDLAGAYAHNAAILQPIAAALAAAEFTAARFDYGITSSDAEATTIRTWISGTTASAGHMTEIGDDGITEIAKFWHPVRLAMFRTWTAAAVDANQAGRYNHATTPPIRRFQAGDLGAPAEFIGPPSAEPLRAEIARRLAEAGHELADHPQPPDAPAVNNDRLIETAATIEAEQMTPAERAALARYLVAGRMDTDIPF